MDKLEGHSRRNNVRISCIPGRINEDWDVCEDKVRDFIRDELGLPEKENVDIERAHRVKSSNPEKCTIIVKFTKFKDRECVLKKARETLRESTFSVYPDYTDKVKQNRRVLGERMVTEREKGHFSTIRFDKLIVNDMVYKVSDVDKSIVCVGRRQQGGHARGGRGNNNNNNRYGNPLDDDQTSQSVDQSSGGAWGNPDDVLVGGGGASTLD